MLVKAMKLVSILRTSTYQNPSETNIPDSFGTRVKFSESPSITVVLTRFGKCMVYGGDSLKNWESIVAFVREKLSFEISESFVVKNMVYKAELNGQVNLLRSVGQFISAEYEPEQFPGVIIRSEEFEKLTLIVFKSGKMMITGIRGDKNLIEEQLIEARSLVAELIPLT